MDIAQLPELRTENFGQAYAAKVLKVDPITKTMDVTIIFPGDIMESPKGAFMFLTDVKLETLLND